MQGWCDSSHKVKSCEHECFLTRKHHLHVKHELFHFLTSLFMLCVMVVCCMISTYWVNLLCFWQIGFQNTRQTSVQTWIGKLKEISVASFDWLHDLNVLDGDDTATIVISSLRNTFLLDFFTLCDFCFRKTKQNKTLHSDANHVRHLISKVKSIESYKTYKNNLKYIVNVKLIQTTFNYLWWLY